MTPLGEACRAVMALRDLANANGPAAQHKGCEDAPSADCPACRQYEALDAIEDLYDTAIDLLCREGGALELLEKLTSGRVIPEVVAHGKAKALLRDATEKLPGGGALAGGAG
ncbi:hypothetical protein LCGC14_0878360 [marine sediment metagenome]|uniref:Uncharacterized protein n=1 Tax=marine sediment metagenome TaxID=412755 RepID=A0A0F9RM38_9ZZZZ